MKLSKKEIIKRELDLKKSIHEISHEFDITRAYVYKVKRERPSQIPKLINVSSLVKENYLNELSINGFEIKCKDSVLVKIVKGLAHD